MSKEAFPAELRVFSSSGLLSISLAGQQRASGSKSTAQLVMVQLSSDNEEMSQGLAARPQLTAG